MSAIGTGLPRRAFGTPRNDGIWQVKCSPIHPLPKQFTGLFRSAESLDCRACRGSLAMTGKFGRVRHDPLIFTPGLPRIGKANPRNDEYLFLPIFPHFHSQTIFNFAFCFLNLLQFVFVWYNMYSLKNVIAHSFLNGK